MRDVTVVITAFAFLTSAGCTLIYPVDQRADPPYDAERERARDDCDREANRNAVLNRSTSTRGSSTDYSTFYRNCTARSGF